ncbi:pyrimidine/purine nucleoside phosphorylase [Verrucomicrobiaceae bacterium R5-34]|nr:pyrimidine/purine nucleoside phosphorylase [Verrucomicrobiaceae bacterium R5-34]
MDYKNVTAHAKANVYFDGKVVSHGITMEDGEKKSFGVIFPGSYHFGTEAAERMDVIDGSCTVVLDGSDEKASYGAGEHFNIAANSGFTIEVAEGICQYVCNYID